VHHGRPPRPQVGFHLSISGFMLLHDTVFQIRSEFGIQIFMGPVRCSVRCFSFAQSGGKRLRTRPPPLSGLQHVHGVGQAYPFRQDNQTLVFRLLWIISPSPWRHVESEAEGCIKPWSTKNTLQAGLRQIQF
jgi:hypothetical protein